MTDSAKTAVPRLAGKTILVVEDDKEVLDMTAQVLSRAGATVVRAGNATEGMACLGNEQIDAAVIDWNLGSSSADTLLSALRGGTASLAERTVVMTGDFLYQGDERSVMRYGFKVLRKPFRPSRLLDTLQALLS